jgi:hypothetical protein
MGRWNPWRSLRQAEHLFLITADLPASSGGGVYVPNGDAAAVVLDRGLLQVERRCVLAHELVHDERGGGCDLPGMPDTWRPVVVREERWVDDEVARRLVPQRELLEFCVARAEVQGSLTSAEVAAEFDVTEQVAERALLMLGGE